MSKKNKKGATAPAEDQTSVAKDREVSAEANSKLADFAKGQRAKEEKEKAAKKNKDGSLKLPPLPRKASAPKPMVDCGCGCGMKTRSKFAPGHDSRLKGWAMRVARGVVDIDYIRTNASEGEANAVDAEIKRLKKAGEWEALKIAKPAVKKATKAAAAE